MANQLTKNKFIIDHDDEYIPVVKTANGEIKLSASFSIAEQSVGSGERLKWLIDFIRPDTHPRLKPVEFGVLAPQRWPVSKALLRPRGRRYMMVCT